MPEINLDRWKVYWMPVSKNPTVLVQYCLNGVILAKNTFSFSYRELETNFNKCIMSCLKFKNASTKEENDLKNALMTFIKVVEKTPVK